MLEASTHEVVVRRFPLFWLLLPFVLAMPSLRADDVETALAAWKKEFAGATPFASRAKTLTGWSYTENTIGPALDDRFTPSLGKDSPALRLEGKDILLLEAWTLLQAAARRRVPTARDEAFVEITRAEYELSRSRGKTLALLVLGGMHVEDYFYRHPTDDVLYAHQNYGPKSRLGDEGLRKAARLLLEKTTDRGLQRAFRDYAADKAENSVIPVLSPLQALHLWKERESYDAKWLLRKDTPKGLFGLVTEIHGVEEVALAEHLPKVEELRKGAIARVRVVLEGLPRRKGGYTVAEAAKFFSAETLLAGEPLKRIKEASPEAHKALVEGARFFPLHLALLDQLDKLAQGKLAVEVQGMEPAKVPDAESRTLRDGYALSVAVARLRALEPAKFGAPEKEKLAELEPKLREFVKQVEEFEKK